MLNWDEGGSCGFQSIADVCCKALAYRTWLQLQSFRSRLSVLAFQRVIGFQRYSAMLVKAAPASKVHELGPRAIVQAKLGHMT